MISPDDITFAQNACAKFEPLYPGINPLTAGKNIEDAVERVRVVDEAWIAWSSFARNYFMAMLNTLAGCKPLALESEITRFCNPAEAVGARAAMEVFWRRELALRGPSERRGGVSLNSLQLAIFTDEAVNEAIFHGTEAKMEANITNVLRGRRGLLRELDPDSDHATGLQADIDFFFGGGRPVRLSQKQRNENFDHLLF